jgi:GAF domain-containing protein
MTAPPDDTDLHAAIAALRAERDAALSEKAALAEALATRNSEYGERIEQQAATIDVLKAMSASPGDPQPVFDLIVERARSFCGADHATAALLQDDMLHLQAHSGMSAAYDADYVAQFLRQIDTSTMFGRAILSRDVMQTGNLRAERDHFARQMHTVDFHSIVAVPIFREGTPIGAIALGQNASGGFTDTQIELLKTFAEQAVIAISSAETYRALQTRTADLQESLEYQTATSDVLKVISRSTFDLKPVLATVAETAARLCVADQAAIYLVQDGMLLLGTNFGFPPEYEAAIEKMGTFPIVPDSPSVGHRAVAERRIVHIHDVAVIPDYPETPAKLGKQRTSLGVPLLRDSEAIGLIMLARQRVEPFTDRQIALVSTFADQAVIAIENARLLTEQQEALEQQTATAEVINASRGKLEPVFDVILEKAMRLCDAAFGMFNANQGTSFRTVVTRGVPAAFAAFRARQPPTPSPGSPFGRAVATRRPVHVFDWLEDPDYKAGTPSGRAIADLGGARTVLNVPLVKDTAVLGMI